MDRPPAQRPRRGTDARRPADSHDRVSIKVYVRLRPRLPKISEEDRADVQDSRLHPEDTAVKALSPSIVQLYGDPPRDFDAVFPPHATQEEVFNTVGRPTLGDVMRGFHCTVFLYGQTGSGKTHTAQGSYSEQVADASGLMPRCLHDVFDTIHGDEEHEYRVGVQWLQIYQDTLLDLLEPGGTSLLVRESPDSGTFVEGAREEVLTTSAAFAGLARRAEAGRVTGATGMNAASSRSHSILVVKVARRRILTPADYEERQRGGNTFLRRVTRGCLFIVDLAGSERLKKTGSEGVRLEEAKAINSSLSTLGNVLQALVDGTRRPPYRESKLTRLLQNSLGGKGMCSFIVTLSPNWRSLAESRYTLAFAERAKLVRNCPVVHEEVDQKARFAELEAALEDKISTLEKRCQQLETELSVARAQSDERAGVADASEVAASLQGAQDQLRVLQAEVEQGKQHVERARREAADAGKRASGAEAERDGLARSVAGLRQRCSDLERERESLREAAADQSTAEALRESRAEVESLGRRLASSESARLLCEDALEAARGRLQGAVGDADEERKRSAAEAEQLRRLLRQKDAEAAAQREAARKAAEARRSAEDAFAAVDAELRKKLAQRDSAELRLQQDLHALSVAAADHQAAATEAAQGEERAAREASAARAALELSKRTAVADQDLLLLQLREVAERARTESAMLTEVLGGVGGALAGARGAVGRAVERRRRESAAAARSAEAAAKSAAAAQEVTAAVRAALAESEEEAARNGRKFCDAEAKVAALQEAAARARDAQAAAEARSSDAAGRLAEHEERSRAAARTQSGLSELVHRSRVASAENVARLGVVQALAAGLAAAEGRAAAASEVAVAALREDSRRREQSLSQRLLGAERAAADSDAARARAERRSEEGAEAAAAATRAAAAHEEAAADARADAARARRSLAEREEESGRAAADASALLQQLSAAEAAAQQRDEELRRAVRQHSASLAERDALSARAATAEAQAATAQAELSLLSQSAEAAQRTREAEQAAADSHLADLRGQLRASQRAAEAAAEGLHAATEAALVRAAAADWSIRSASFAEAAAKTDAAFARGEAAVAAAAGARACDEMRSEVASAAAEAAAAKTDAAFAREEAAAAAAAGARACDEMRSEVASAAAEAAAARRQAGAAERRAAAAEEGMGRVRRGTEAAAAARADAEHQRRAADEAVVRLRDDVRSAQARWQAAAASGAAAHVRLLAALLQAEVGGRAALIPAAQRSVAAAAAVREAAAAEGRCRQHVADLEAAGREAAAALRRPLSRSAAAQAAPDTCSRAATAQRQPPSRSVGAQAAPGTCSRAAGAAQASTADGGAQADAPVLPPSPRREAEALLRRCTSDLELSERLALVSGLAAVRRTAEAEAQTAAAAVTDSAVQAAAVTAAAGSDADVQATAPVAHGHSQTAASGADAEMQATAATAVACSQTVGLGAVAEAEEAQRRHVCGAESLVRAVVARLRSADAASHCGAVQSAECVRRDAIAACADAALASLSGAGQASAPRTRSSRDADVQAAAARSAVCVGTEGGWAALADAACQSDPTAVAEAEEAQRRHVCGAESLVRAVVARLRGADAASHCGAVQSAECVRRDAIAACADAALASLSGARQASAPEPPRPHADASAQAAVARASVCVGADAGQPRERRRWRRARRQAEAEEGYSRKGILRCEDVVRSTLLEERLSQPPVFRCADSCGAPTLSCGSCGDLEAQRDSLQRQLRKALRLYDVMTAEADRQVEALLRRGAEAKRKRRARPPPEYDWQPRLSRSPPGRRLQTRKPGNLPFTFTPVCRAEPAPAPLTPVCRAELAPAPLTPVCRPVGAWGRVSPAPSAAGSYRSLLSACPRTPLLSPKRSVCASSLPEELRRL